MSPIRTSPRYDVPVRFLCSLVFTVLAAHGAHAGSKGGATARGAGEDVEAVLRLMPNPAHGREIFRLCASCHGAEDTGLPKGWVPEIAGQHVRVIVKQLVDFRHGRRWDLRMEVVAGRHILKASQDIVDVASYAASLTPVQSRALGAGEGVSHGQQLYEAHCLACHGRAGEGSNTRFVPRLEGQDYYYLLRQLHDAIDGRRPGLTATHAKLLRAFDAADLEGLADYLSKLQSQSGRS